MEKISHGENVAIQIKYSAINEKLDALFLQCYSFMAQFYCLVYQIKNGSFDEHIEC